MYSPEKSQVEICLLKSNLEEIENELIVQRSSWSKFDTENEQKFRKSLNAVKASRELSVEIEKVNQENVRLVAKRMHLKNQSTELAKALEKAREDYSAMEEFSNNEKREVELLTRKYEDALREKTCRFRETRAYLNEVEMNREIEKAISQMSILEKEVADRRRQVETLTTQLESLVPDIPVNLFNILGKNELDGKIISLTKKCEQLQEKRNEVMKTLNNTYPS